MCDKAGCNPAIGNFVKVYDFIYIKLCAGHLSDLYDATIGDSCAQYQNYERYRQEVKAMTDFGRFPPDALWNTYCATQATFWAWMKNWLATP
jgi:hypothetical protein